MLLILKRIIFNCMEGKACQQLLSKLAVKNSDQKNVLIHAVKQMS